MMLAHEIDGAVGETRSVMFADGRPARIDILRWSDEGRRARWGELFVARVRTADRARRGAFLDLALKDEQGFLPFDAHGHMRIAPNEHRAVVEGETLVLRVTREGANGKSPVVEFVETLSAPAPLGRRARAPRDEELAGVQGADAETRVRIDAALDEALARDAGLRGGGRLIVERTAALTAIDVDAGGRRGSPDPEIFARDLDIEAAHEAVRQLILRSQGGLAAIDFVSLRGAENRRQVEAALKQAAKSDHWGMILAPMSRFGVVELSRAQLTRPVRDILCDETGAKTPETLALEALRAIERESAAARGRKIVARLPARAADWLDANVIPWRAALEARIGVYWEIEAGGAQTDVRAL